jgi:thiol-disulfide isomerase/thioredoxin
MAAGGLSGCKQESSAPGESAPPERFAGVKKTEAKQPAAGAAFCDKRYSVAAQKYTPPAVRPLPGAASVETASATEKRWTWVNLWATWCQPCVEEMPLLGRWRDGFSRDGVAVAFELLSVDSDGAAKELGTWLTKQLPGPIKWVRSEKDTEALLASLGVNKDASIPIHALVDPAGWIRCVRVGAVGEQDYGAVRELLR